MLFCHLLGSFYWSPFLIVFDLAIKRQPTNGGSFSLCFDAKQKKFKTDTQRNCILWTFWVTMTVLGHIDISVSLTTQSHSRKNISLQLEQKTAWVSAWWRTKNSRKQRKQATMQFWNSVQPGKKMNFAPRLQFAPRVLPFLQCQQSITCSKLENKPNWTKLRQKDSMTW